MGSSANSISGVRAINGGSVSITQSINNYYRHGARLLKPAELPRCEGMFDREDVSKRFWELVESGSDVLLIRGLPGVGKTTCLQEWANACAHAYPDGQLYIDAGACSVDGVIPPHALQRRALRSLGYGRDKGLEEDEVEPLYRTATASRSLLIAVDNVIDIRDLAELVPNSTQSLVIGAGNVGEVIGGKGRSVELDCFDENDSLRYVKRGIRLRADERRLRYVLGRLDESPAKAASVMRACAGLPVILDCVVELLLGETMSLDEILDAVVGAGGGADGGRPMLFALLDEMLAAPLFSWPAKIVYRLLGCLEGAPVRMDALRHAFRHAFGSEGIALLNEAVSVLRDGTGLAKLTSDVDADKRMASSDTLVMHRQICLHAARFVACDHKAYEAVVAGYVRHYRLLSQRIDYGATPERLRTYECVQDDGTDSLPASVARASEEFHLRAGEFSRVAEVAIGVGMFEDAHAIAEALWVQVYESMMLGVGIELFGRGLEAARCLGSPDAVARMSALLSRCHLLLGDEGLADNLLAEALGQSERTENHVLRGSILEFAGSERRRCGDWRAAIDYYREAQAEYVKGTERSERGIMLAEYLLGVTYLDMGDTLSSFETLARLKGCVGTKLRDDVVTRAKVGIALARALKALGRNALCVLEASEAAALCVGRSLASRRAEALCLMGEARLSMGDAEEAAGCFEGACECYLDADMPTRAAKALERVGQTQS